MPPAALAHSPEKTAMRIAAKLLHSSFALLAASLCATWASAQTVQIVSFPDAAQQGTVSAGTGVGTGTLDLGTNTLTFDLSFSGLTSNQTAGHVHGPAAPGQNGGIQLNMGVGQQTGTVWNMSAQQVQELTDGLYYFNIHTANNPGGEIRGQITVVPETYCKCSSGPCGNNDAGAGCANSTGSGSSIQIGGQASVALDSLTLTATGLPANQNGLFYMGPNQTSLPFGDGERCVGGQVFRFGIQNAGSSGQIGLGPGLVAFTVANFPASGQITAGSEWNLQCWYRNPGGPCGSNFNLSDAVNVTFTP